MPAVITYYFVGFGATSRVLQDSMRVETWGSANPKPLNPKPWVYRFGPGGQCRALIKKHPFVDPDPREDLKSRSLKGVPIKYPLVARVPN